MLMRAVFLILSLLCPLFAQAADNPLLRQSDGSDVRQGGVGDAAKVTQSTLQAGEDTTNNIQAIEFQGDWETVAASQTDQVMGTTGAAGDLLEKLVITVGTAATAAVSIKDGTGSSIPVMPNSPGGGIGVYVVPLGMVSADGGWKVTTGAGATVVAVGRFQ